MVGVVTPGNAEPGAMPAAMFLDLERRARTLGVVAAGAFEHLTIAAPGEPTSVACLAVTPRFFEVLGVSPALGRGFTSGR
jgi:hypothetical protein